MKRSFVGSQDPDAPVRTYRVPPTPERHVHYPGMAALANHAIQAALSGRMTVDQLVAWCEEAEGRWPLIGWREAAEALRCRLRLTPRGRIREARAILQAWEGKPWTSKQRTREELARQQAVVLGMDGQPVADAVPF